LATSAGEALTVSRARALLAAGLQALEERKQEINDLNVYPVPDGDTGTNLALTVRGIVDSVARLPEDVATRELCNAISQAALMGARGNSGVILSQIVRGAMEVLGHSEAVDARTLSAVFRHATDTAYRAVRRPVEGTMLTVLRDMAEAAAEADISTEMGPLTEHVVSAGWQSVERTPSLLKVLADAGVVDAGGYGLVVLIEGAARGGEVWEAPISTHVGQVLMTDATVLLEEAEGEESRYTYCTSLLVSGRNLDKAALEQKLSLMGDSLLVVGDSGKIKVHVHTDDPGRVLAIGTSMGVLSEIEIDNMREQTAARSRRLSEGAGAAPYPARTPAEQGLTQLVAVVAGEGNKELFRNLGVDFIVDGGQSMNPSAQDLMTAVEKATAPSVIILPNNGNVIMTAEQTTKLTDRNVIVVPTRSVQAGLSAAVAYEKRNPGEQNARDMRAALDGLVTAEVTRAVRDSVVDGVEIKAQDFIGLLDDTVVTASPELDIVVTDLVGRLLNGGRAMLTVLVGEGDDGPRAVAALQAVRTAHPEVEIDLHEGGQPFYPLLLSAE
jgi:DAK2 domain fusion protein YloV